MKAYYDIVKKPIITEKTSGLAEKLQYTFEVDSSANKVEIKDAIEHLFNVKVIEIRTVNVHQKPKRMQKYAGFKASYKKAVVRLAPGQTIKQFEI
jgi:large subunit ribosomal protein L23